MKRYTTLLFDLDDTLLDFDAAETWALRNLFQDIEIPLTEDMMETYKMFNKGLWKAHEEGKIEREELVNTRFSIFFEHYGKKVDGIQYEKMYRHYLKEGHLLIDGALDIIKNIYKDYQIYIVTNGIKATQTKRIKDSGLEKYFQKVFVSEEIGYQKPRIEFFEQVFNHIGDVQLEKTLIIGDSITSDILGGVNAGIDSCWFNPSNKENITAIKPTYEISDLKNLHEILNDCSQG